jgi:TrmH family RNA methyltransferase
MSEEHVTVGDRELPRITSVRNRRIVAAANLADRSERRATGRYLVEGQHPVAEAMGDGHVETLYVVEERAAEVCAWPGADDVDVVVVHEHVLERMADTHTPQGMIAVARTALVEPAEAVWGTGVAVLLVGANDPGNVGALIRTADAAGATGVVLTDDSCDPYNPKAVRAAAGSTTHLDLAMVDDPVAVVEAARAAGRRSVALAAHGNLDLLAHGGDPGGDLLVLGSEAHGLPAAVLDAVDVVGYVPIRGRAESLNLAVAGAIAMYAVGVGAASGR